MASSDDDDVFRLAAVVERQRGEIDAMRAGAAADAMVAMARGVLVERLGCPVADAAARLDELAAAAGLPVEEMAAAVLQRPGADVPRQPSPPDGPGRPEDLSQPLNEVLAEAAAALAGDGAELTAVLAGQVSEQLGAEVTAVWLLEADGALDLLGEAGLGGMEASRWRRLPPQLDCPAQRIVRGGPDLWWHQGRPQGTELPVAGPWPDGARAVLALRRRGGDLLGVLEAGWQHRLEEFSPEDRMRLSALATGFAEVLGARMASGGLAVAPPKPTLLALLDEVAGPVIVTSAIRAENGRVTDFAIEHVSGDFRDEDGRTARDLAGLTLLKSYPASISGQGLFSVALGVLEGSADSVDTAGTGGLRAARFFDGVIFTWRGEGVTGRLTALLDNAQRLGRLGGWEEDLTARTVRWSDSAFALFGLTPRPGAAIRLADLHSFVIAADRAAVRRFCEDLLRQGTFNAATFRIVRPDDGSIRQIRVFAEPVTGPAGTVTVVRGAFQDVSAHYHTQMALAATRDQLADSEQRAEEEHHLALRLQRAIMPPEDHPVDVEGLDVAVRYRPAGPGHLVGGDWYDTLLLPGGEMLLVVGDVAGHGIDAVTGMIAARNALRGLAITGAGPAALVGMLNSVACHFSEDVVGTVVCGLYNRDTRMLRWARAGHLPPVPVRGDGARSLPLPGGVLLGMDPDGEYEEMATQLKPGDTLLLFTDGLIEQRGVSIGDALAGFAAAAGGAGPSASALAARLIREASSDTDDDACLVAVGIG